MFELSKSLMPLIDKIFFVCHTRIKSLFHFLLFQAMIIYHSYLWLKLYPAIRLGCLSSTVSPGEGPTFRSSRWSGRVQILTSSKIQFLTDCGPEAPQISATGSLHRAAPNMAVASRRVRE